MIYTKLWGIYDINALMRRIETAKNKRELTKIIAKAKKLYGVWSMEYVEILAQCWDKLHALKGEQQ